MKASAERDSPRIPISGGAPESTLETTSAADIQCAQYGEHTCLLSESNGKQTVFPSFDPVRGRLEELARIDGSAENSTWSLSPDGMKVVLVEWLGDNVRILDLKSKQLQVIDPNPPQTDLQYAAWSADGQKLFATGFDDYRGRLLEMDMEGHAHVLLENRHGWIGLPLPSPDGKRIAYTYAVTEANVTLLEHF